VTRVGLPALAVTIGTLALYRGVAVGLLGTTAVTQFDKWWTALVKARIGTTASRGHDPVRRAARAFRRHAPLHPVRRGVFAIGRSKDAATFSGVHVDRTR